MGNYMTVLDFAKAFQMNPQTLYRLIKAEKIPHYRIGRRIMLNTDDFRKGNHGSEQAE